MPIPRWSRPRPSANGSTASRSRASSRASSPATSRATPARAWSSTAGKPEAFGERLFVALPLSGHAEHDADAPRARLVPGRGLRHLDVELIDKQEGHAGLEVVQYLLQRRLLHLAADDEADEAVLGFPAEHVDLRRLDG